MKKSQKFGSIVPGFVLSVVVGLSSMQGAWASSIGDRIETLDSESQHRSLLVGGFTRNELSCSAQIKGVQVFDLISRSKCEINSQDSLTFCGNPAIEMISDNSEILGLPYETRFNVVRSESCKVSSGREYLEIQLYSKSGELVRREIFDYMNNLSKEITLLNHLPVARLVISSKDSTAFLNNIYSPDCQISLVIKMNALLITDEKSAKALKEVLQGKLERVNGKWRAMELIEKLGGAQEVSEKISSGLLELLSQSESRATPLMGLNSSQFQFIIDDQTGVYTEELKDYLQLIDDMASIEKLKHSTGLKEQNDAQSKFKENLKKRTKNMSDLKEQISKAIGLDKLLDHEDEYIQKIANYEFAISFLRSHNFCDDQ